MVGVTRQPLYAPRGAVATSQPLAASAGLAVLRRGGTAVDAAIATAAALTVVQPPSNDLGGDLFAIVWDGTTLHGLNGSGRAPAALTPDRVTATAAAPALGGAQATRSTLPARGWLPVTVPGVPAGWRDLHSRFGRLPFAALFTDAIRYAADGYPVSPMVAASWQRAASSMVEGPEFAGWWRVFGPTPAVGERFTNPDAARTLRLIAETDEFYRGSVARAVADFAAATGGLITADDFAAHTSTWVEPVSVRYRDHEVWELPPNGQGLAALLALRILDGLPPGAGIHEQVEAMKLGFDDAHRWVGDPDVAPAPLDRLLSDDYVASRRALIGSSASVPAGEPVRGGTVYLCAADGDGMMVSLIQSTYMGFGSGVVAPGTGFVLQNRGVGFSLDPAHPAYLGPGRRPYHTIIPGFLTRGGAPVGPFGVMGGHMQPQGHVQVVLSTVDGGLDPQAALDRPRWYWHTGLRLMLEPGLAASVPDLAARGHDVRVWDRTSDFGYGQAIWRLPSGGYVAGSEPRADGQAVGY